MCSRFKVLVTTLIASAGLMAFTGATAFAWTDENHRWPANRLSPKFKIGNSEHRVGYGVFGNVPFAGVRLYGERCGRVTVSVITDRGEPQHWHEDWPGGPLTSGGDNCGSYVARQATGFALAKGQRVVGMVVTFPATKRILRFLRFLGEPTRASGWCADVAATSS